MAWLLKWFMFAQSTLISYHTEAFVKTEVGCTVDIGFSVKLGICKDLSVWCFTASANQFTVSVPCTCGITWQYKGKKEYLLWQLESKFWIGKNKT